MPESANCKKIIFDINNATYNISNDLRLIIIHGSALDTKGLQYLNNICNKSKIKLICFSGGVSQLIYNSEGFEYLNINSSEFYSEGLIPFLEKFLTEENIHLLEVANVNWELTYLFLARQIINIIQQEEDEDRKLMFQDKLEQMQLILKNEDIKNIDRINLEITKKMLLI